MSAERGTGSAEEGMNRRIGESENRGERKEKNMKVGTKSVLFGVHQFVWHPFTVSLAWLLMTRFWPIPTWRHLFCFAVHDLGYWGRANMDDEDGERHVELGAQWALRICGEGWDRFCLLHSRHYARRKDEQPSMLCWADKLSIIFEPWWFYLPRAWASGELYEYRHIAAAAGFVPLSASHRQWFRWVKSRLVRLGRDMRGDAVPHVNPWISPEMRPIREGIEALSTQPANTTAAELQCPSYYATMDEIRECKKCGHTERR